MQVAGRWALVSAVLLGARASVASATPGPSLTPTVTPSLCEGVSVEEIELPTADGAAVHLHHHPGPGAPVLVVHGLSSNSRSWDLSPDRSLAVALHEVGLDAWLLDLRGHGAARRDARGRRQTAGWSIDDYGRFDLPAAIEYIRERRGGARVGYVGHSMGGMVALAYAAWHGDAALSSLVIVGSPIEFTDPDPLLRAAAPAMISGRLGRVVPSRGLSRAASRWDELPFHSDELLWAPGSVDGPSQRRMMREAVSPMSAGELTQLSRIIRRGRFTSLDGRLDYEAALRDLRVPLRALAGRDDHIAPPDRVIPWVEAAGSAERDWWLAGRASGLGHDYGHIDLILGDDARREIFPQITGWLLAHPP